MSSSVKGILVEIGGDTSNLQSALAKVNSATASLTRELKGVNSLLKLDPGSTEMLSQKQEILKENIKETTEKLEQLKQAQEMADDEILRGGEISKENYRALQREIKATEEKLAKLKAEASAFTKVGDRLVEVGNHISNISKKLDSLGNTLTTKLTLPIVALGTAMANASKNFESAFTGVEKTVEGTEIQLAKIKQGIKDMAEEIPSTTTEISKVAESAGQLGIATDDVLDFTRVMIDLGNSTNLSAEEASSSLAKFANVTKMSASDYERLGSTIVALGNNFATTESDIVSMATKLASTGELTGLTQSQILSLATAMSSVGIEAEAGGSAMSKLLKKIQVAVETGNKDLTKYAKVAGTTAKQFKTDFERDAIGTLSKFISGLNNTERNGKSAIAVLNDMGLTEVRLSNTILSLANASTVLNDAVELGSKAWKENTALSKEAGKRYQTLESRIQTTKNKLMNLAINMGDKLTPSINKILDKVDDLIDRFDDLSEEEVNNIIKIGLLVASIGPAIKILSVLGSTAGTTITTIGNLSKAIGNVAAGVTTASGQVGVFTKIIGALVSPAGLATTAILALVAGMYAYAKYKQEEIAGLNGLADVLQKERTSWEELKKTRESVLESASSEIVVTQNLINELDKIVDKNGKVKAGYEERAKFIVNELNNALGTEISLNGDIIENYKDMKSEVDRLIQSKKVEAVLNAYQEEYASALKKQSEATDNLVDLRKQLNEQSSIYISKSGRERMEAEMKMQKISQAIRDEMELISEYGYTIQNYEALQTASISNSAEEIDKALGQMSISWEKAKESSNESIAVQITNQQENIRILKEFLIGAKQNHDEYQASILESQIRSEEQQLQNLYDSLMQQTATVTELTPAQVQAFQDLSSQNLFMYLQYVNQLSPEMQEELYKVTGIITNNTSVKTATRDLASNANTMFWREIVPMSDEQRNELDEVSTVINTDTTVETAAGNLGKDANSEFKKNSNGYEAGADFDEGAKRGIEGNQAGAFSAVRSFASSLLGHFKEVLGISSPSKETAKFAEYFVEGFSLGIIKNEQDAINDVKKFASGSLMAFQEEINKTYQNMSKVQNEFSSNVIDGTKTIFTTPNINFYVQELDENNMEKCFKYVDRKFGSQY